MKGDFQNLNAWKDDINLKYKIFERMSFSSLHSSWGKWVTVYKHVVAWFQDSSAGVIIIKLFKYIFTYLTIHSHRHPLSMTSNCNSSNAINNYEEQRKDVTQ